MWKMAGVGDSEVSTSFVCKSLLSIHACTECARVELLCVNPLIKLTMCLPLCHTILGLLKSVLYHIVVVAIRMASLKQEFSSQRH